jgi:hypothetical protein
MEIQLRRLELIRHSVVLVLLLVFSSLCFGQTLWQGTTYGMTVEQVRAVIPKVSRYDSAKAEKEKFPDGMIELLRLENVELVNNLFTARFYFLRGRLAQVMLSLKDKGLSSSESLSLFDSLAEILRLKYGKEFKHQNSIDDKFVNQSGQRKVSNRATTTWIVKRTNIELFLYGIADEDDPSSQLTILTLVYQGRVAREADKL